MSKIDVPKELQLIRKALQSIVAIQRADAKRVARFEREAAREAKASKEHARSIEKIRARERTADWVPTGGVASERGEDLGNTPW